jgi:hypothetical protein
MTRIVAAFVLICALCIPAFAQDLGFGIRKTVPSGSGPVFNTTVFNCSSGFASSGACGATDGQNSWAVTNFIFYYSVASGSNPSLTGSTVILVPGGSVHVGSVMNWQTAVNFSAWQTNITYVANGWNLALVINNNTNNSFGATGPAYTAGAGCEAGFWQGFGQPNPPNFVFAALLDQWSDLTGGGSSFEYSSAQVYETGTQAPGSTPEPASAYPGQSPCNPDLGTSYTNPPYHYVGTGKFSTYPVALNPGCVGTVGCTQNGYTGDTYSATYTYYMGVLTLDLFDVTAGGTCTPVTSGTCFTQSWTVNIGTWVGGTTAFFGLGGGSNASVPNDLVIKTWSLKTP